MWRTEPGLCPTLSSFEPRSRLDWVLTFRKGASRRGKLVSLRSMGLSQVFFYELINPIQHKPTSKNLLRETDSSAMTTFLTVREQFFMEKTLLFLKGFETIDENFRNKFDKVIANQNYKKDLEERLIIALDRFDQLAKADALFKVFVAHINKEINRQEFLEYLYVLDKIDLHSIEKFKKFYVSREEVTNNSSLNSFAFVGLLTLVTRCDVTVFGKNEFGSKFLKILGLVT